LFKPPAADVNFDGFEWFGMDTLRVSMAAYKEPPLPFETIDF
jgi:hypothetical protein